MASWERSCASVLPAPLGGDGVVALPAPVARVAKPGALPTPAQARARAAGAGAQDDRDRQVREWLWLLLRFAITRDPEDELAAMVMAGRIDWLGRREQWSPPTFFRKSSIEVCRAIAGVDDPAREAVLKRHISRIGHVRLRRAFQAAVRAKRRSAQKQRPVAVADTGADKELAVR